MFEQIVDWLRILSILQGLFIALGVIFWVLACVTFTLACMHAYYMYYDCRKGYGLFKTKNKDGEYVEYHGLWKPWVIFGVFFALGVLTPVGYYSVPTKEYIVLKAVAPRVDKYVEEHPDSLFAVENLAGVIDNTAKGVLDLVGTSSVKVKELIEHKVDEAIQTVDPKQEKK